MNARLLKYNIAAPRYTSYPTVPHWDVESWCEKAWLQSVKLAYEESSEQGISVYIHLPFCENLCTYCGCNTRITKNHAVEEPYIKAVIAEWKMYTAVLGTRPRVREIHLGGGTPTFFSADNLKKLLTGIFNEAQVIDNPEFSFEAHPANTTAEHLQTLFDLGFRRLSLGIQDFDPKVQFVINRKQTYEQVAFVTAEARKLGYTSINYDLIYGLPLQEITGIENTIKKVLGLMPDRIAFYSYAHVPWIKPGQRRFTEADLPQDEEKRALYEKGLGLLSEAGYFDIGMDHFALKTDSLYRSYINQSLHRNFMGYTDRHTQLLVGLGVSSISDSLYAFAQNVKQVEEYIHAVSQGNLPLFKGHLLSPADLTNRKHIADIMCKGTTICNWIDLSISSIKEKLMPLEQDGLIEIQGQRLKVTNAGKAFLRNICMAFDEYVGVPSTQTPLFSKVI